MHILWSTLLFLGLQLPINWFRADGTVNWEAEKEQRRIKTDTIVIHHTGQAGPMDWQKLSDIQKKRLYEPRFLSDAEPKVKGLPVQSGHFRLVDGKKVAVFYAYHWLIEPDGSTVRLLNIREVGWHSGDWEVNNRSLAICFDGDFSKTAPSDAAIRACAQLIADYQKRLAIKLVIGHQDVKATDCPGEWFKNGGRDKILARVWELERGK